jgi:hypothetical protein
MLKCGSIGYKDCGQIIFALGLITPYLYLSSRPWDSMLKNSQSEIHKPGIEE